MDLNFANGYFKAKSTTLLQPQDFNELSSLDEHSFFSHLNNKLIGPLVQDNNIENILVFEKEKLIKDFKIAKLDDYLFLINLEYDLTNLILLYKEKHFNIDARSYFIKDATYSYDFLKRAIILEDYELLDDEEKELFEYLNQLEFHGDANLLASLISSHIFKTYYEKFKRKDKALKEYFNYKITLTNIKTFLRVNKLGLDNNFFMSNLIDLGNIKIKEFIEMSHLSNNTIATRLSNYFYNKDGNAFSNYFIDYDLSEVNEVLDKLFLEQVKSLDLNEDTLGPVLYYLERVKLQIIKIKEIYYKI
jgi:vacuolar-type H+-ATPase subunit C/Vma6